MDITRSGSQPSGRGTAVTHIAVQEQLNGSPVDWMEKVSDEQYQPGHARANDAPKAVMLEQAAGR